MFGSQRANRRKRVGGAEADAFSKWRYLLKWADGERADIKRRVRRRERRAYQMGFDDGFNSYGFNGNYE